MQTQRPRQGKLRSQGGVSRQEFWLCGDDADHDAECTDEVDGADRSSEPNNGRRRWMLEPTLNLEDGSIHLRDKPVRLRDSSKPLQTSWPGRRCWFVS